ncbi:unnamed protein product [Protopolystoma xenopodis]|uniref:Malate dehydrogenase n=1 Tax=Protopolystoma xenopodis TaxID=117903 RepID=A0A3S5C2I8_9PLAT|nr:unnamed protein product [Protopolystoma xenopodis]
MIARGDIFGPEQVCFLASICQPVVLKLLEITPALNLLDGIDLELQDCAFPLLAGLVKTDDPLVAFKDADCAILVGAMPRKEGMERKDLLKANVKIFKEQGIALDKVAKKTVKVLVVGNPANTNCLICSHFAPSIPKENFSALTRLDHNRALAQVSRKLNIPITDVRNVIIWGNHSVTQFPDVAHATVKIGHLDEGAVKAIADDNWIKKEFLITVQKRGGVVLAARKSSSAMSAAKAAVDHMRSWWSGTPEVIWSYIIVLYFTTSN